MTHQFKFGDRVKCFPTPGSIGVVLSEEDEYGYVNVMFDDALEVEDFPVSGLELIPHPDTVRLDWIIKNGGEIQDSDGYVRFCISPDVTPDLVENTRKCREVIDAAMSIQAAEAV